MATVVCQVPDRGENMATGRSDGQGPPAHGLLRPRHKRLEPALQQPGLGNSAVNQLWRSCNLEGEAKQAVKAERPRACFLTEACCFQACS